MQAAKVGSCQCAGNSVAMAGELGGPGIWDTRICSWPH